MYLKTYMGIFSHFQNSYTQSPQAIFAFYCTKLSLMPHLLQTYVDTQFQYTTKLAPHLPQNVHFKIRCCIDKTQKLASNKVFRRCE